MAQNTANSVRAPFRSGLFAGIAGVVGVLVLAWGTYMWFFCRVYVPAGMMAVVTAKTGKTPKPGTILVERGDKGIWREVLSEGRYFFDPFLYDVEYILTDAEGCRVDMVQAYAGLRKVHLENGRYNPSILLAHRIAQFFGMAIEDVFIFEEE